MLAEDRETIVREGAEAPRKKCRLAVTVRILERRINDLLQSETKRAGEERQFPYRVDDPLLGTTLSPIVPAVSVIYTNDVLPDVEAHAALR